MIAILPCEVAPGSVHVWAPAGWTTEEHHGVKTTRVFRVYCQYCLEGAQPKA